MTTPKAEPFGYFRPEPFGWTDCAKDDDGAIALYETPPQRKPLSDEEILKVYDDMFDQIVGQNYRQRRTVLFAKAIERAHGIGSEE